MRSSIIRGRNGPRSFCRAFCSIEEDWEKISPRRRRARRAGELFRKPATRLLGVLCAPAVKSSLRCLPRPPTRTIFHRMISQPEPKADILARRDAIIDALTALLPPEAVIAEPLRLKPYETDGLPAYRQIPLAVVLPDTTEQVASIMRYCHAGGIRVVPRGAGTSLSGGALP